MISHEIGGIAQFHLNQALASRSGDGDPLKRVAREFEALFLSQLLSVMREGMGEDGLFEGIAGRDIYGSMMDQALAGALAERGGIGLAETVYRQLKELDARSEARTMGLSGRPAVGAQDLSRVGPDLSRVVPDGRLSSAVGWRRDPFSGDWRYHRGVDLAAPEGTRVKSLTTGRVVFSGRQGDFGNTVVIENERGTRVRYAHLRDMMVERGEEVAEGQRIGSVGSTGRATGSHLHLEVESRGRLVDPLSFGGALDGL